MLLGLSVPLCPFQGSSLFGADAPVSARAVVSIVAPGGQVSLQLLACADLRRYSTWLPIDAMIRDCRAVLHGYDVLFETCVDLSNFECVALVGVVPPSIVLGEGKQYHFIQALSQNEC